MSEKLIVFLKNEFANRKKRNAKYSLRALARDIGVSHSVISEYMSGKRNITKLTSYKIMFFLKIQPSDYSRFNKTFKD
jgi:transcriptional regulator with XRE-family HTH domain